MLPLSSSLRHIRPANVRAGERGMIHGEPKLEEILSEPIVLMLAERDGVKVEELHALVDDVRRKMAACLPSRRSPP